MLGGQADELGARRLALKRYFAMTFDTLPPSVSYLICPPLHLMIKHRMTEPVLYV